MLLSAKVSDNLERDSEIIDAIFKKVNENTKFTLILNDE